MLFLCLLRHSAPVLRARVFAGEYSDAPFLCIVRHRTADFCIAKENAKPPPHFWGTMLPKAHMDLMGLSPMGDSPEDKAVEFAFGHLATLRYPHQRSFPPAYIRTMAKIEASGPYGLTGCTPTFPSSWTTLINGHLADAPIVARS